MPLCGLYLFLFSSLLLDAPEDPLALLAVENVKDSVVGVGDIQRTENLADECQFLFETERAFK